MSIVVVLSLFRLQCFFPSNEQSRPRAQVRDSPAVICSWPEVRPLTWTMVFAGGTVVPKLTISVSAPAFDRATLDRTGLIVV